MANTLGKDDRAVGTQDVFKTWLPLAGSWALMGAELPLLSAVVARLSNPEIHLAAYGGIVFPISLLIESPIIMLLAASTALSKDWDSYKKIKGFMVRAGATLTLLHALIAFTPLFDLVAKTLLGAPNEILEPARIGLRCMLPWTWAIAYRRFNQGILIRFGLAHTVGIGTMIRLFSNAAILGVGYWLHSIPGVIVATVAVSTGVLSEAAYSRHRVRPVLQHLKTEPSSTPLTTRGFLKFYIPLAVTPLFTLAVQPVLTAAMSRMPQNIASLAVWPAVNGLIFMVRALGIAYNEVVVAIIDRPGGFEALKRFTRYLAIGVFAVLSILTATPLARLWFQELSGLKPELATLAHHSLWITLFVPSLAVALSWFQGILVQSQQTRAVTEAVALFAGVCSVLLISAAKWVDVTGIYAGLAALTTGSACQTAWLCHRSAPLRARWQAQSPEAHASLKSSRAPPGLADPY